MIFNQPHSLGTHAVFKNSDKFRGLPLACYLVNASKKEKSILYEQCCTSQRHGIIRCCEGFTLKNVHTDEPHQSFKISNKKQSP